jgi:lipopolysaccharide transport protein LptA
MFFSFAGNVTVISDKFQLSSDRLDVISSKEDDFLQTGDCGNSIKEVHAFGNVKFTQNCRSGMADEVIVDPASGTVTLLGNATIVNPDGTAHGDKLFLNRDSNLVKVESAGRSVVSINDFKKNQMPDKKLEPCNGCPNFAECEPDE